MGITRRLREQMEQEKSEGYVSKETKDLIAWWEQLHVKQERPLQNVLDAA